MTRIGLVGILNITPDSFSDGGGFPTLKEQIAHAHALIDGGASIVDIGGDSTRPGSVCVGIEEEWRRIGPAVEALAPVMPISVDTHHSEVARRALQGGAKFINDVSGGSVEMFDVVQRHNAKIVVMYSRCTAPHLFDKPTPADLVSAIKDFFSDRLQISKQRGLARDQIFFDPGMGGFVSESPRDSFLLIQKLRELQSFEPLYIGVSRKGFLQLMTHEKPHERDAVSAYIGARIVEQLSTHSLFLRVHNPKLQREFLSSIGPF